MNVPVALYPQLTRLCSNRPDETILAGAEALALYERNWRFVDAEALEQGERDLIARLTKEHGNGVFLAA